MKTISRRSFLNAGLSATLVPVLADSAIAQFASDGLRGSLDAATEGLRAGALDDQSELLRRALLKAESSGQALFLPPGRYDVAHVALPGRAHMVGVPGRTVLVFRGGSFMLSSRSAALLRLQGITLDGAVKPLGPGVPALLDAQDVDELVIDDCAVTGSAAGAFFLRSAAGRVERCSIENAGTVGLNLVQSRGMSVSDNAVSGCGDTGILIERDDEGADDTIVSGNRVTAIRANSGGTGQYGNGINVSKANGVVVSGNRVDSCAFSAIRCFSADSVQVSGNIATRSGEMAVYVEFASEGAIVSGNLIDGGNGGISFANFQEHGGRLAVCSGNIVRNITGGPRYADGNPQTGAGIGGEADIAITGNVIENAVQGLQLGWGPYLRDIAATGNVIRSCQVGIAVSVAEGAGAALISGNLIAGAEGGAVVGMRWEEAASGDLAVGGAEAFPHLTVEGNRVS